VKQGRFKAPVDSDAFISEVNNRAMKIALNMSKFNQPGFTQGVIGVPAQFLQFITHQSDLMFGKDTPLSSKIGIWASWIGAFGYSGVPFFWDAIALGEWGLGAIGHPEYDGTITEFLYEASPIALSRGGIAAVTDGELDFSRRAGLGDALSQILDKQTPSDLAGPGVELLMNVANGQITSVPSLVQFVQGKRSGGLTIARGMVEEVPGLRNPIVALEAHLTGRLEGRDNRLIKSEPTLSEIMMTAMGITPGSVVDIQKRRDISFQKSEAWKDWVKGKSKSIAGVFQDDQKFGKKMLVDAVNQVAEFNPTYLDKFMRQLNFEFQAVKLPDDKKQQLREMLEVY
jgi:hypothetical protein